MVKYNEVPFWIEDYTGPSSYIPGGFTVTTKTGPTLLLDVAIIQTTGGYNAYATNITNNQFTIQVFTSGGTEVTSGTNLTTITFKALEFGAR